MPYITNIIHRYYKMQPFANTIWIHHGCDGQKEIFNLHIQIWELSDWCVSVPFETENIWSNDIRSQLYSILSIHNIYNTLLTVDMFLLRLRDVQTYIDIDIVKGCALLWNKVMFVFEEYCKAADIFRTSEEFVVVLCVYIFSKIYVSLLYYYYCIERKF